MATEATVNPPRIVVVQPGRPAGYPYAWLSIGVQRWLAPEPRLTILAKSAFNYAPVGRDGDARQVPRLVGRPPDLSLGEDSIHSREELYYPNDFVPRKGAVDLLLSHLQAALGELAGRDLHA